MKSWRFISCCLIITVNNFHIPCQFCINLYKSVTVTLFTLKCMLSGIRNAMFILKCESFCTCLSKLFLFYYWLRYYGPRTNVCLFTFILFLFLFIYLFIEWFISSLIFFLQLFITSSFRKHIPSGGSSRSNHMAGRAIDLNLSWPGGLCNKSCMRNEIRLPSRAKCFITKIRNDRSLRWGGDFNDPGHIDDNLNNRDRAKYYRLRNLLQPICRKPWQKSLCIPNILRMNWLTLS